MALWRCLCERAQRVPGQSVCGPSIERDRADGSVERDRRFVPVEYGPLHAGESFVHREASDESEQGVTDSSAAVLGLDVEVYDVNSRTPSPGRKGTGVDHHPYRFIFFDRQSGECARLGIKQRRPEELLVDLDLIGRTLKLRELVNQSNECWEILTSSWPNHRARVTLG